MRARIRTAVFVALTPLLFAAARCSHVPSCLPCEEACGYSCETRGYGGLEAILPPPPGSTPRLLSECEGRASDAEQGDLFETVAAADEELIIEEGTALAQQHNLPRSAGIRIARSYREWATLGGRRSRSLADLDIFMRKTFGLSYSEYREATAMLYRNGEASKAEDLFSHVARFWRAEPAAAGKFLALWLKEYQHARHR